MLLNYQRLSQRHDVTACDFFRGPATRSCRLLAAYGVKSCKKLAGNAEWLHLVAIERYQQITRNVVVDISTQPGMIIPRFAIWLFLFYVAMENPP